MLEQHAEDIGIEGRGVALRGLVGNRAGLAFGAGVVDGDVEAAEPGDGLVDELADVVLVADVGTHELSFRAQRTQLGDQRSACVIAAAGNDDIRAFPREGERAGAADTGQGTCDQNNWMAHETSPQTGVICLPGLGGRPSFQ
jgi:hypothetical protein